MSHERLEQRSLAFHRAVAEKLQLRPELLPVAMANLDRWANRQVRELQQSTPFDGILEPKERWRVYDTFESGTHHTGGRDAR